MHMKRHPRCDNSPLVCPIEGCGERFNDKVTLRGHIDAHYGREPEKKAPREKRQKISAITSQYDVTYRLLLI